MRSEHRPLPLHGIKTIIVENDYMVADSLQWLLQSYGCEVTGIAGTLDAALALIAHPTFDVAILDIQLVGANVAPVAARIREQGGRIVYLTGYGNLEMLPGELRGFPHLVKPVDSQLLVSTILDVVGGAKG